MNLEENNKAKIIKDSILSLVLSVGSFLTVYLSCGSSYAINDDRYMAEILSGATTGVPDPHAIFIHYFLGLFISALYLITTRVPWYGLFMTLCMIVTMTIVFYEIMKPAKKALDYVYAIFSCALLAICCFYFYAAFQFSTVSGILGATGYFLLMKGCKKKTRILGFIILETLSYWVRHETMLLVQPIGCMVWAALFFAENEDFWSRDKWKQFIKQALSIVGIVVIIIGLSEATHAIGYGSKEWKEYREYNVARSYVEDYSTGYSHQVFQDILDKYGVSREQFDLSYQKHWCVSNHIERECLLEVVERLKEHSSTNSVSLKELVYRALTFGMYDDVKGFFVYNYLLYLIVILAIFLQNKWRYILPVMVTYGSKFALLLYLASKNRYPFRVTGVLFFAEMIFLVVILLKVLASLKKPIWKKYVMVATIFLLGLVCLPTAKRVYIEAKETNNANAICTENMHQLMEYFEGKNNGYIVDITSMMYFPGEVFDVEWYQYRDILISGGWFSNAPFMLRYEESYLEKYEDDLYIVTSAQGKELDDLNALVKSSLQIELSEVCEFVTDNGEKFIVYKIERLKNSLTSFFT